MNKYRIKIIELNNGTKKYYPQYKYLSIFWRYFYNIIPEIVVRFNSLEEAQDFIKHEFGLKTKSISYAEVQN